MLIKKMRFGTAKVMRLVAGCSQAKVLLGLSPLYNLREGLQETINWFEESLDSYQVSRYEI